MPNQNHKRSVSKPRRRLKAWIWISASAVLLAAAVLLVLFVTDLPCKSVFPGQWYCQVENTNYVFTEDGGFTVTDSQNNTLLSGTYRAGWRYLTLRYITNEQKTTVRTRYTYYDNGQLVLHNVNSSQVVLVSNPK